MTFVTETKVVEKSKMLQLSPEYEVRVNGDRAEIMAGG